MRQYVIDELRPAELDRIKDYLDNYCERSDIGSIFWLRIPDDMLTSVQSGHVDCRPHYAAVELGDRFVNFEMLIRSREKIRCNCVAFATPEQRDFILSFADAMLDKTEIKV
ncbi:MAG TPA: hypothetical protein EYP57_07775 [Thermodesulfobacteriaceae bacterium]|nr:hypothetical protein [Thermodesulfobacteriaceae bacterium]